MIDSLYSTSPTQMLKFAKLAKEWHVDACYTWGPKPKTQTDHGSLGLSVFLFGIALALILILAIIILAK